MAVFPGKKLEPGQSLYNYNRFHTDKLGLVVGQLLVVVRHEQITDQLVQCLHAVESRMLMRRDGQPTHSHGTEILRAEKGTPPFYTSLETLHFHCSDTDNSDADKQRRLTSSIPVSSASSTSTSACAAYTSTSTASWTGTEHAVSSVFLEWSEKHPKYSLSDYRERVLSSREVNGDGDDVQKMDVE